MEFHFHFKYELLTFVVRSSFHLVTQYANDLHFDPSHLETQTLTRAHTLARVVFGSTVSPWHDCCNPITTTAQSPSRKQIRLLICSCFICSTRYDKFLEVASNLHLTHKRAYNLSELINRARQLSDSTPANT